MHLNDILIKNWFLKIIEIIFINKILLKNSNMKKKILKSILHK